MKINVHQAICGQGPSQGWELLDTTLPDLNTAKILAYKSDLNEQSGGILWNPCIRGFCVDSYYLIMKTFPDTSPGMRPGRAFSHVFILEKGLLPKFDNILNLFSLLPFSVEKDIDLDILTVDTTVESNLSVSSEFQGRFNKVVHGYLKAHDYNNTILWSGQEDFEIAVSLLWLKLLPDERIKFNFGLYFNADNVPTNKINFIATPSGIITRFRNSGFLVVDRHDNYAPSGLAEMVLSGNEDVKIKVNDFLSQLGVDKIERSDLAVIGIGMKTAEDIDTISDLKRINSLSHIISNFSPDAKDGGKFKTQVVEKIASLINSSSFSDILVLRTFKFDSFSSSKKILENAFANWINENIFLKSFKEEDCIAFFNGISDKSNDWLLRVAQDKLAEFFTTISIDKAGLFYAWYACNPTISNVISSFISGAFVEDYFLDAAPGKKTIKNVDGLKQFALSKRWLKLHAKFLLYQFPAERAIKEQLKIDTNQDYSDGISLILKGLKPQAVVKLTMSSPDIRLIKMCGVLFKANPNLLNELNISTIPSQILIIESVRQGIALGIGIKNAHEKIYKFFDLVIEDAEFIMEFLNIVCDSDFGNITLYPQRLQLWEKLPYELREKSLHKTSSALLDSLSKNSTIDIPDDEILRKYISENGINDFVYFNRGNIKSVIPIFEKFTHLPDGYIAFYVRNYSGSINAVESKSLGKLINSRYYKESASAVYDKADRYNNWKYALAECQSLLDIWDKAKLAFKGIVSSVSIPTDEWWGNVEDLIIELYENPTSLMTLWKKAGGKEADLKLNGTTREAWNDALIKLRKKSLDGITMDKLLREVNKKYSKNSKFEIIYDLRKHYIQTKK